MSGTFTDEAVAQVVRLAKENIALRADLDRLAAEVEAAAVRRSADLAGVEAQCAANLDRAEAAEAERERLAAQVRKIRDHADAES
jgi:hypothetical protein